MFTNNFYKLLYYGMIFVGDIYNYQNVKCKIVSASLNMIEANGNTYPSMKRQFSETSVNGGVAVGTSGIEETKNDVTLPGLIAESDITINYMSTSTFNDDTGSGILGAYTLTNNTDADITVREVGLYARPNSLKEGASSNSTSACLIDRTVLKTPIVVPANGSERLLYMLYFEMNEETV